MSVASIGAGKIERMVTKASYYAPIESALIRMVRPHEVLEVIDGNPRLWPNAAALKGVSDERAGKVRRAAAPVFWSVGAEEIPRD